MPGHLAVYSRSGVYNPEGTLVREWGYGHRQDRVWVSSLNDRVQCFTPEGKLLMAITTRGAEPGQLARPHGMATDSHGNLYVADAGNQRIQKFALPP